MRDLRNMIDTFYENLGKSPAQIIISTRMHEEIKQRVPVVAGHILEFDGIPVVVDSDQEEDYKLMT